MLTASCIIIFYGLVSKIGVNSKTVEVSNLISFTLAPIYTSLNSLLYLYVSGLISITLGPLLYRIISLRPI